VISGVAGNITLTSYILFEPYVTAAAIDLCLTFIIVGAFQMAERRWVGARR
jgi:arginine/ornithine transport system permease protein